jgi:hypothetical protein
MHGIWNCISIKCLFTPNGLRSSELCPFYSNAAICPKWFQTAQRSICLPYLFVRVFNFVDLGRVGIGTWWSFWFLTLYSLYLSYQVLQIWWEQQHQLTRFGGGNAWVCNS